jgi:hypothetical protein
MVRRGGRDLDLGVGDFEMQRESRHAGSRVVQVFMYGGKLDGWTTKISPVQMWSSSGRS